MGIGRFVEYKETRHDEGSIRPTYHRGIETLVVSREVRGDIIAGHLILLAQLRSLINRLHE